MERGGTDRQPRGMRWRLCAGLVALGLSSSAGCGGGAECSFNSDCAAGSYCASGGCRVDCSAEMPCPSGEQCTSFGMCVAVPDAGAGDGGPLDAGTDSGPADAGPPEEVCTPSTDGAIGADEDGDGAIDEGCPWHFGIPHPVHQTLHEAAYHWFPRPTEGGLAIVFGAHDSATDRHRPFVSRRATRSDPFGRPELIAGFDEHTIPVFSPSASGDEAFLQVEAPAPSHLAHVRRSGDGWGVPTRLFGSAALRHPAPSPDGRELFFEDTRTSPHRIAISERASSAASFETIEALTIPGDTDRDMSPWPIDAQTLLFVRRVGGSDRVMLTTRTGSRTFSEPIELEAISAVTSAGGTLGPAYSPETRELFFSSNRAWSPAGSGNVAVWRVEVCRDGPCPTRQVECAAPGIRSPDGLHCYFSAATTGTRAAGVDACAAQGAHLPTLHSQAEHSLLWAALGSLGAFWVAASDADAEGTWRWTIMPEEAWTFSPWSTTGEPNNCLCFGGELEDGEHCAELQDGDAARWGYAVDPPGSMNDVACGVSRPIACERDLWPTW